MVRISFDLYSSLNFPSDQKLLQNAEVTKNGKALVFPHGNSLAFGFCHGLRTSRDINRKSQTFGFGQTNLAEHFWGILGVFSTHLCFPLKFIYSEKATKFCEIFSLLFSYVVPVKSKLKISQNFVVF